MEEKCMGLKKEVAFQETICYNNKAAEITDS